VLSLFFGIEMKLEFLNQKQMKLPIVMISKGIKENLITIFNDSDEE
jgi:hypothetical protein